MIWTTWAEWKVEISLFLQMRITAIFAGSLFCAAFYEATFVHPNIVERLILVSSAFTIGWYFSRQYNDGLIRVGRKVIDEGSKT